MPLTDACVTLHTMIDKLALNTIRDTAAAIARSAGALLRDAYDQPRQIDYKGTVDLVTQADRAAEETILTALRREFPQHAILAEESGQIVPLTPSQDGAGLVWLIDPLDGTTNFAHAFPVFAVSIALRDAAGPLVGIIYDPLRDECFSAVRGQGAALNGEPIRVSSVDQLQRSLLATGFPYDRHTAEDNNTAALGVFLRRAQGIRRAGAAAIDLAYVACGRLDGYWEMRLHPWDLAAGVLIVREAGGRITGYRAAAPEEEILSGAQVVASNGLIHEEMLAALATLYG
ncbi:MAG: inositol monophosphatase family protein [Anaerolineae bacterium]